MYFNTSISATMRERKHLDFALELKRLDEKGQFAGYASVFNVIDNQRDIILPGAFAQSIHKGVSHIKFLWQHQQDEPIGLITSIHEDGHGLYVQGILLLNVQRAQEAHSLLKAGAISGLSIGYSPVHYTIDPKNGVRLLAEVELWEVSLVTFPANAKAKVTMIKSDADQAIQGDWKQAQRSGEVIKLANAIDRAIAVLTK